MYVDCYLSGFSGPFDHYNVNNHCEIIHSSGQYPTGFHGHHLILILIMLLNTSTIPSYHLLVL
jgi:hypothetical protein